MKKENICSFCGCAADGSDGSFTDEEGNRYYENGNGSFVDEYDATYQVSGDNSIQ